MKLVASALVLSWGLAQMSLPPAALAQNLVANPALARDLPPPGWIVDRRADWVAEHPVYKAACRNAEVSGEIAFLNKVIGRDESLLVLAGHPAQTDPALARMAILAQHDMELLRRDIAAISGLITQLQALPACGEATAAAAATAPAVPRAAEPKPPPAATEAVTPPPAAAQPAAAAQAGDAPAPLVIRFDDRVAALTPSGIRAFKAAVKAVHSGKAVQLMIDGCAGSADFSKDSPCARRLATLEHRLAEEGVKDPKSLFGDLR